MSMTTIPTGAEWRAIDAARATGKAEDISDYRMACIVRAVLAEAGVAELVEALTELLASGNDYLHPDTLHIIAKRNTGETIGDIVNAALAKIGANQ